jgi:hypothetical protein
MAGRASVPISHNTVRGGLPPCPRHSKPSDVHCNAGAVIASVRQIVGGNLPSEAIHYGGCFVWIASALCASQ